MFVMLVVQILNLFCGWQRPSSYFQRRVLYQVSFLIWYFVSLVSDISCACQGHWSCDICTQAFFQGNPVCYSNLTVNLRLRTKKLCSDIADVDTWKTKKRTCGLSFLVCLFHPKSSSWFTHCTHVWNGGVCLMPPRYLYF